MIGALNIHVTPDTPRKVLSDEVIPGEVPWPPGFKAEMDAWMLAFFGASNVVADGQSLVLNGRDVLMNPRTYAKLKCAVAGAGLTGGGAS